MMMVHRQEWGVEWHVAIWIHMDRSRAGKTQGIASPPLRDADTTIKIQDMHIAQSAHIRDAGTTTQIQGMHIA
jgi:hypothetical protein